MTSMSKTSTFSGTARNCGAAYAQQYQREIAGFFSSEFGNYKYSKKFVRGCLKAMEAEVPKAAAFIHGAASKSLLSVEEHALLLLHEEELYHRSLMSKKPHCSAVGAVVRNEAGSRTIIGQNWDWNTSYFPWMSFNWFALKGLPQFVSLSYPGLPACAGINSSGLTLMWTGAGYYPPLMPVVGVPTYALVFELLSKPDVKSAIRFIEAITNSGAFIFLLGDRAGNLACVEAVPGKSFTEYSDLCTRTNAYESSGAIKTSRQKLPSKAKCHSVKRKEIFADVSMSLKLRPGLAGVKKILSQKDIKIEKGYAHASIVQLVADSKRNSLEYLVWRQQRKSWVTLKI